MSSTYTLNGVVYTYSETTASVTGYTSGLTSATIVNSITIDQSTYTVTSIGYFAFESWFGLTSIDLSGCTSLTSISFCAFANCINLTSITFTSSLTSIGDFAFYGCTGLTSITFPSSLTSISSGAFYNCTGLTSIDLSGCTSLTSINNYAFYNCLGLTSITFPSSLGTIGSSAFQICTNLSAAYFNGLSMPTLSSDSFTTIANPSTAYYLPGVDQTSLTAFKAFKFFTNYIEYTLPCFLKGSNILTNQGYKEIETLKKGDLVKTLKNGFLPIVLIGKKDIYHPASKERTKDQLYQYSPSQYQELTEELVLTGCHSILVNCLTQEEGEKTMQDFGCIFETDGKPRLMTYINDKASIYPTPGNYTIYHFALENKHYTGIYGVYANGLLVETCSQRYLQEFANMNLINLYIE